MPEQDNSPVEMTTSGAQIDPGGNGESQKNGFPVHERLRAYLARQRPPLPIEPASRLYLVAYDRRPEAELVKLGIDIYATEARFVELFHEVWTAIPSPDRNLLVKFWREDTERWCALFSVDGKQASPGIRLMDHMPGCSVSCKGGHSLYFHSSLMADLADDCVRHFIAVGLAFARLHASGDMDRFRPDFRALDGHTGKSYQRALRKLLSAANLRTSKEAEHIGGEWGFPRRPWVFRAIPRNAGGVLT